MPLLQPLRIRGVLVEQPRLRALRVWTPLAHKRRLPDNILPSSEASWRDRHRCVFLLAGAWKSARCHLYVGGGESRSLLVVVVQSLPPGWGGHSVVVSVALFDALVKRLRHVQNKE